MHCISRALRENGALWPTLSIQLRMIGTKRLTAGVYYKVAGSFQGATSAADALALAKLVDLRRLWIFFLIIVTINIIIAKAK